MVFTMPPGLTRDGNIGWASRNCTGARYSCLLRLNPMTLLALVVAPLFSVAVLLITSMFCFEKIMRGVI
jgi:hypothetical protein